MLTEVLAGTGVAVTAVVAVLWARGRELQRRQVITRREPEAAPSVPLVKELQVGSPPPQSQEENRKLEELEQRVATLEEMILTLGSLLKTVPQNQEPAGPPNLETAKVSSDQMETAQQQGQQKSPPKPQRSQEEDVDDFGGFVFAGNEASENEPEFSVVHENDSAVTVVEDDAKVTKPEKPMAEYTVVEEPVASSALTPVHTADRLDSFGSFGKF